MPWQATALLRRLRRHDQEHVAAVAAALHGAPDDLVASAAARVRRGLGPAGQERLDDATGTLPGSVVDRMLGAGGSVDAVAELAAMWPALGPAGRRAVADPVRALARRGRQGDGTTCGSSVLTMVAASGDPAVALWLGTGRTLARHRPPEVPADDEDLADATPERRFARVQRRMRRATSAGALLGLPWPGAFGTPPWGLAARMRFAGLRFTHEPLDDSDRPHLATVLDLVGAAVDRGVPVPLYSGGDSSGGWDEAMPRHVLLAVRRTADGFDLWEPASGRVLPMARAEMLKPKGRHPALGGWSHLTWAVLPDLR